MPDDSIPRSIALIALILSAGFFAACETAFSYCNKIRIKMLADDGDKKAQRVIAIVDSFDRALVTLLVGTNVVHVAASTVATVLAIRLFGSSGTLISTVAMTLLVFLFSEMLPKSIARANADDTAMLFSLPLKILMLLLLPVEYFFIGIGNAIKKLFGAKDAPTMTEDEFASMITEVEQEGVIDHEESEIIRSAIEFGDLTAKDVMIPIDRVIAVDRSRSRREIRELVTEEKYSRFPVYDRDINRIIGVLQARDYLFDVIHGKVKPVSQYLTRTYYVNPNQKLGTIFEEMGRLRTHMAIVGDDEKRTLGIVTMEDILEEIVGEIYDEHDSRPEKGAAQ